MERLKYFGSELIGVFVGFFCWFTPEHCDHVAKIVAVLIGIITLLFITLPKAWDYHKKRREK